MQQRLVNLTHQVLASFVILGLGTILKTAVAQPALVDMDVYPEAGASEPMPSFKVDANWPNMPSDLIIGQVPGLAVDSNDNLWLLQRPNSLGRLDLGLDQTPKTGLCCSAAPHVLQFSPQGELLKSWGGPQLAPSIDGVNQWPQTVHGLYVDSKNTVWIGGNGKGDHVVLNFTADGQFIKQFGQRGSTLGNKSTTSLGNPADIYHDTNTNEVIIADGYINKRIIGFDSQKESFKRFWGAYASVPGGGTRQGDFSVAQAAAAAHLTSTNAKNFGDIVHCVTKSIDGLIYICDRRNNRLQIFKDDEQGNLVFVRDLVIAGETKGLGTASDVAFSPDNKYLFVADMMNGRIWVLLHDTYEVLGSFGRPGRYPGQFTWLHSVVSDSKGNLYTSEVSTGRRVQKLVLVSGEG